MSARVVDKPWGNELVWAHTDQYMGKILHIKKGHSLSLQYHNRKDETIMVLSGKMEFIHYREGEEPKSTVLLPRQPFHVAPGLRHRMTAVEDCDVVAVSTAAEADDVVRLDERAGRNRL
jgi:mannose-6-phosphate isomerase-like protein (cupin superfamily)